MTHVHCSYRAAPLWRGAFLLLAGFALLLSPRTCAGGVAQGRTRGVEGIQRPAPLRAFPPVSELLQGLRSPDPLQRRNAALALFEHPEAKVAAPALSAALEDNESAVRSASARVLLRIEALPRTPAAFRALLLLLEDEAPHVRGRAISRVLGFGEFDPHARETIPALTRKLQDGDPEIRKMAAVALRQIGDSGVTTSGLRFGGTAPVVSSAVSSLAGALYDGVPEVRLAAAEALAALATSAQASRSEYMVIAWTTAQNAMAGNPYPEVKRFEPDVRKAVESLKAPPQPERPWNWLKELFNLRSVLSPWTVPFWAALVLYFVYRVAPIGVLRIAATFPPLTRILLRSSRIQQAWISRHRWHTDPHLHRRFGSSRGLEYVRTDVVVDGQPVADSSIYSLVEPTWKRERAIVLIWGDAGTGKTRLCYEILSGSLSWLMHPMLPIWIDFDPPSRDQDERQALLSAVRREVQALIASEAPVSEGLVEALLRSKRLVLIVDGFSEMPVSTRRRFRFSDPSFPASAVIVTSRNQEDLGAAPRTEIKVECIQGNRLGIFLDAYLSAQGERGLFTDAEYFDAVRQLALLAAERDVTALLACWFAEIMVSAKREGSWRELPKNIPDLVTAYLDFTLRQTPFLIPALKLLARECLRDTFRPGPVRLATAHQVVAQEPPTSPEGRADVRDWVETLWNLGLLDVTGVERDLVRFRVPVLAEYLAALDVLERCGGSEAAWREFLRTADRMEGAPESIRFFLLAVQDCCLAKGKAAGVPDFAVLELAQRTRSDMAPLRQAILQKNLRASTALLSAPGVEDRLLAARQLGEAGPAARDAVPALSKAARDADLGVRTAAIEALSKIDPAVIPKLIEEEKLAREIEEARDRMQRLLELPQGLFTRPGLTIVHRLRQATTISGDFYNFILRPDGSLGIYLVDVEGHGLAASQQAQAVYQLLSRPRGEVEWGMGRPRRQLERADQFISEELQQLGIAVTMNFTEIDPASKVIRYANAGMPSPFLFRHGQSQPESLQAAGVYVGGGYRRYPVQPAEVEVQAGEGAFLVLCSDGILEARDSAGRLFGRSGVIAAVSRAAQRTPECILEEILAAATAHQGTPDPEDDQTVIVVQVGEAVREFLKVAPRTLEETQASPGLREYSLMNAGDTGAACYGQLREAIKQWATESQRSEEEARKIWGATWEAIQNAVKHGSSRGDVIQIRLRSSQEGHLEVELRQPKLWRDWDAVLGFSQRRAVLSDGRPGIEHGGGAVIMLRLADELGVSSDGRRLLMRFRAKAAPAEETNA